MKGKNKMSKILELPVDIKEMLNKINDTGHPRGTSWNPNLFRREFLLAYLNDKNFRQWISFLKENGIAFGVDESGYPLIEIITMMSQRKAIAFFLDSALGHNSFSSLYKERLFSQQKSFTLPRVLIRWDFKDVAKRLENYYLNLVADNRSNFARVMPLMLWLQTDCHSYSSTAQPDDFDDFDADSGLGYESKNTIIEFHEPGSFYIIGGFDVPTVYNLQRIDYYEIEAALHEFYEAVNHPNHEYSIVSNRFVNSNDGVPHDAYDETAFIYFLRKKYPYADIRFVEQLLPVLDTYKPFNISETNYGYAHQTDLPDKYKNCPCIDIGIGHIYKTEEFFKRP
ncbi:MAG: hypothetical protein WC344_04780 [Bacilli bacterium]|jgi:hypothetical protein